MQGLQALRRTLTRSEKKQRAGQSLIEMAMALPVMLIMISGLIEFGFALNQYLNALDAAREAARYSTDGDPLNRDLVGGVTDSDCGTTLDFYMQAACIANQTMYPVDFNLSTDDVVISVFRVLSGTVIDRWPNCEPNATNDCPFDPSPHPDTMGEWHLYGRGDGCGNGLDDDGDTEIDDGCGATPVNGTSEACDPDTDDACHPSRITAEMVEARLEADAPDSAVILVEVFYDYPHVLQLPWITPFVPNPLPLHTYTVLPLPAAEPSLTITGTVTTQDANGDVLPVSGVTINFDNGAIAITDSDGHYVRTGFSSGWVSWSPDISGSGCTDPTPASYTQQLTTSDLYHMNFVLDCIDEAATVQAVTDEYHTQVQLVTEQHATDVFNTQVMQTLEAPATQTAAAASSAPATETATPTQTATVSPSCSEALVGGPQSRVSIVGAENTQADGSSTIEVLVEVLNECGTSANMSNRTVTLSSSRGSDDTITPGSVQTDGAGLATFFVRSAKMSNWDVNHHDFEASTFSAVADGMSINDTAGGAFMCVGGVEATATNFDEVNYRFQNDTGIDRRLVRLTLSRTTPVSPSSQLIEVLFDVLTIFNTPTFANPETISTWVGVPSDRHLNAGASKELLLVHDFDVTGGNGFTVSAVWDNTSGTSECTSNDVEVIR